MIREIKAIVREDRLPEIFRVLHAIPGLPGVTVSLIKGFGRRIEWTAAEAGYGEAEMAKLELVVPTAMVSQVTAAIQKAAYTGRPGDGKIFVIPVENAINVRTGAQGLEAL